MSSLRLEATAAEQERREAWKARELAKAGPLTQEQQAELRRVLLPAQPLSKPA